jgi:hypothetical protein
MPDLECDPLFAQLKAYLAEGKAAIDRGDVVSLSGIMESSRRHCRKTSPRKDRERKP